MKNTRGGYIWIETCNCKQVYQSYISITTPVPKSFKLIPIDFFMTIVA